MFCRRSVISASQNQDNHALVVLAPSETTAPEGNFVIPLTGEGSYAITWDKRVAVAHVLRIVDHADGVAYERGVIDEDGPRKRQPLNLPPELLPKLLADRAFSKPGRRSLKAGRDNAEKEVAKYQDPENLLIIETTFSICFICHKRDEELIRKEAAAVQKVAARHGIDLDCRDPTKFTEEMACEVDTEIIKL